MAESQGHDVVVIGASAGGIEGLTCIARGLPADIPAALFVVLHLSPSSPSAMPAILSRSGALLAVHPRGDEPIERGKIYVAPPDHHLLIEADRVLLGRGPRENRMRPGIDVLFRSAALACGPRVIGVVLSGYLDDGAAGLLAIKQRGGLALVQDPDDAPYPSMPRAAIQAVVPDHVERIDLMAALIDRLVRSPVTATPDRPGHTRDEVEA